MHENTALWQWLWVMSGKGKGGEVEGLCGIDILSVIVLFIHLFICFPIELFLRGAFPIQLSLVSSFPSTPNSASQALQFSPTPHGVFFVIKIRKKNNKENIKSSWTLSNLRFRCLSNCDSSFCGVFFV